MKNVAFVDAETRVAHILQSKSVTACGLRTATMQEDRTREIRGVTWCEECLEAHQ